MGLRDQYSAADLASLAPEELAALETADGGNTELLNELAAGAEGEGAAAAAAPAAAPAAQAPAAAPAAAAAGAPAAAPAAAGTQGAAAPAAQATAAVPAAAPAAGPAPAPAPTTVVYSAKVPEVAKEVLAQKEAIKTARATEQDALRKLNDGEIDFDAYSKVRGEVDAKVDAANDKLLELNRAQTRAETAAELTEQQQSNAWRSMLTSHMAEAKTAGIDYLASDASKAEFNGLLRAFATEAEASGMVDGSDMAASRWALKQAADVFKMRHPVAAPAAPAAGAPAAAPVAAPAPAAAAAAGIPQTLSGLPAAAAAPVGDDVMAKIGTLEGEDLEKFMASLPKDQYARLVGSV